MRMMKALGEEWDTNWPSGWDAEDRVRAVVETVRQPRTVGWIATRADVGEECVREVLEQADDIDRVHANGERKYRPDSAARRERLRDQLGAQSEDELRALRAEIEQELEEWEADDEIGELRRRKREYLIDVIDAVLD